MINEVLEKLAIGISGELQLFTLGESKAIGYRKPSLMMSSFSLQGNRLILNIDISIADVSNRQLNTKIEDILLLLLAVEAYDMRPSLTTGEIFKDTDRFVAVIRATMEVPLVQKEFIDEPQIVESLEPVYQVII